MKDTSGFTLVELLITVAIFGLVGAIAIPNFLSWRDNQKFSGGVFTLVGDLSVAKQTAIRQNENVVISFSGNTYSIWVDNGDGTTDTDGDGVLDGFRNGVRDGSESIIKTVSLPAGVNINTMTFSGNMTQFNGRGRCPSANVGSIQLADGSNQRSIEVNRLGRVTVN